MPYIITTTTPSVADISRLAHDPARGGEPAVTRTAVATLGEARAACRVAVLSAGEEDHAGYAISYHRAYTLPESGGTVGPLPDGTVIEVRPMLRDDVTATAGEDRYIAGMTAEDMVNAFNAA